MKFTVQTIGNAALTTSDAFSWHNYSTELMRISAAGRLGLGITAPSSSLHVSGSARITSWTMINSNVTPTAPLEVSGTISATRFVGDGSGLTNITAASSDRIVSGTGNATSMVAVSATGMISVTQNGVNTAYFHPTYGLVSVGVSTTGGISGTTGYFSSKVGLGTNAPTGALHVIAPASTIYGTFDAPTAGFAYHTYKYNNNPIGYIGQGQALTTGGSSTDFGMRAENNLIFGIGTSEKLRIANSGNVGIGTTAPNANLEVSGTVSATTVRAQGVALVSATDRCRTMADIGTITISATGRIGVCRL